MKLKKFIKFIIKWRLPYSNKVIITEYKGVFYSEKEWQETFPIEGELVPLKRKKHWKGDNPNGRTESLK